MIVTANRTLSCVALLLACALRASAQTNPRVDTVFAQYDKHGVPGCAVAVSEGSKTVFSKGYGSASLEHDLPITPSSAFYAASVSKQFTAFAVALLAKQGKLSLDDDIRTWIPEVPDFGKKITVRHLIHHTSGLRDYFGLLGMTDWPSDGPITEARFLDLVSRQKSLNFDPGERHLYSNTGYVLLSILVKRVSRQSLREFADSQIFGPLGMTNSHFRDDHTALVKNRALAYAPQDGAWKLDMPGFDVVGDGGLFTTVEDLAKWARNSDTHAVGGDDIAKLVLTRGKLNSGDSIPYGFGLSFDTFRGLATIEHGGAFGGYRTQVLRFPNEHLAVLTLCNVANANAAALSRQVAALYLGDRMRPATAAQAGAPSRATAPMRDGTMDAQALANYAGDYYSDEVDFTWRIVIESGSVRVRRRAMPDVSLIPASADTYTSPFGTVHFTRDQTGRVTGFLVAAGRVTGLQFVRR